MGWILVIYIVFALVFFYFPIIIIHLETDEVKEDQLANDTEYQ